MINAPPLESNYAWKHLIMDCCTLSKCPRVVANG